MRSCRTCDAVTTNSASTHATNGYVLPLRSTNPLPRSDPKSNHHSPARLRWLNATVPASAAEVSLAWLHSLPNVATLVHSTNPKRLAAGGRGPSITLDNHDLAMIAAVDREWRAYDDRSDPWHQPGGV